MFIPTPNMSLHCIFLLSVHTVISNLRFTLLYNINAILLHFWLEANCISLALYLYSAQYQ